MLRWTWSGTGPLRPGKRPPQVAEVGPRRHVILDDPDREEYPAAPKEQPSERHLQVRPGDRTDRADEGEGGDLPHEPNVDPRPPSREEHRADREDHRVANEDEQSPP